MGFVYWDEVDDIDQPKAILYDPFYEASAAPTLLVKSNTLHKIAIQSAD